MKDYKLSEMKKICENTCNCHTCQLRPFCERIEEGMSLTDAIIALENEASWNKE